MPTMRSVTCRSTPGRRRMGRSRPAKYVTARTLRLQLKKSTTSGIRMFPLIRGRRSEQDVGIQPKRRLVSPSSSASHRICHLRERAGGGCPRQEDGAPLEVEMLRLPWSGRQRRHRPGQEDEGRQHGHRRLSKELDRRSAQEGDPRGSEDREGWREEGNGSLQGPANAGTSRRFGQIHSGFADVVTLWAGGAALLLVVAPPPEAAAQARSVNPSSTTLFLARHEWRDGQSHTATPFLERVGFSTQGPDAVWFKDVRFNVLAWGLADPSVPDGERVFAGDVDLAYVQATMFSRRLSLRVGRQLVVGGAVRATSIDGLSTELMIWRGIGVSAYGGLPVVPRFAVARGDAIVGARAFWRQSIDTEMGVSFIELLDHGLTGRQDLGIDARWAPSTVWAFNGSAIWSLVEAKLAEGE